MVALSDRLDAELADLRFAPPVTHVYRPLRYARAPHAAYLQRFGGLGAEALLVGMNPGPWGMAQTGVPFGAVHRVRDWLGIDAPVEAPSDMHPKRPVEGFACARREVSGDRLWGWAADVFGTPERFFRQFFVHNHCPLLFLEASGRNRTPDKLPRAERESLRDRCDQALREVIEWTNVRWVIGVGQYAETRARAAAEGLDGVRVGRILHPSPASPAANRGWAEQAHRQLCALGLDLPSPGAAGETAS
ncbi:MAG: uracil-DNA glycosylase family protein [Acidobacteriota bacterium]